jgi:hypothetical protein
MKKVHNSTVAIVLFWTAMVVLYIAGFIFLTHS